MAGLPVFGNAAAVLGADLGADWEFVSVDQTEAKQPARAVDGEGDVFVQTSYDQHVTGSETYHYVGTVGTYNGTAGALAGFHPGKFLGTAEVVVTGVEIDYGPCASGQRETVKFSYDKSGTADSRVYAPTVSLPIAQEGSGIPIICGTNDNADSKTTGATYAIKCDFGRTLGGTGQRIAGATYGGEESVNLQFAGQASITWPIYWTPTTSDGKGGANTGYSTSQAAATKGLQHN